MRILIFVFFVTFSSITNAGWHEGKVSYIGVGYDGTTITITLEGWSRSDCTCYSAWPGHMCLDPSRNTSDFEKSLVIAAKARQVPIKAHIDETTCQITAISESS